MFAASKGPCVDPSRHYLCFENQKELRFEELQIRLNFALPCCCRQLYQETRSAIFSANTWSFNHFLDLECFYIIGAIPVITWDINILVRRLHLDISISNEHDEHRWDRAFLDMSRTIRSLQDLHLDIDQYAPHGRFPEEWKFKNPAECSFLAGVRKLRDLRLSVVTVIVSGIDPPCARSEEYTWTMAQRQEWAGYISRFLLRQEDREMVTVRET